MRGWAASNWTPPTNKYPFASRSKERAETIDAHWGLHDSGLALKSPCSGGDRSDHRDPGSGVVRQEKVFFHPSYNPDAALAELTGLTYSALRYLPPGIFPPVLIKFGRDSEAAWILSCDFVPPRHHTHEGVAPDHRPRPIAGSQCVRLLGDRCGKTPLMSSGSGAGSMAGYQTG